MAVDETDLLFMANPTSVSYCDREQFLLYKGIHYQTLRWVRRFWGRFGDFWGRFGDFWRRFRIQNVQINWYLNCL
jgi:hypothetical protein